MGKNNLYGHPSDEILQRLEKSKIKVHRTDLNGEITLVINKKGIIKINNKIY